MSVPLLKKFSSENNLAVQQKTGGHFSHIFCYGDYKGRHMSVTYDNSGEKYHGAAMIFSFPIKVDDEADRDDAKELCKTIKEELSVSVCYLEFSCIYIAYTEKLSRLSSAGMAKACDFVVDLLEKKGFSNACMYCGINETGEFISSGYEAFYLCEDCKEKAIDRVKSARKKGETHYLRGTLSALAAAVIAAVLWVLFAMGATSRDSIIASVFIGALVMLGYNIAKGKLNLKGYAIVLGIALLTAAIAEYTMWSTFLITESNGEIGFWEAFFSSSYKTGEYYLTLGIDTVISASFAAVGQGIAFLVMKLMQKRNQKISKL